MTDDATARTPLPADADDHEVAAWAATEAGHLLLEVRQQGLEGRALKDAGDLAAHELLMRLLAEHRPDDAVLCEEGKDDRRHACTARPGLDRRPARRHPGVLRAATRRLGGARRPVGASATGGELVAGAVALPGSGTTFDTGSRPSYRRRRAAVRASSLSRTRPPAFVQALVEELGGELVPMGSAGAKVMSVVRDVSDAYVHAGGQYEWDSAAPVAVARAAGLFTSRVDGSPLVYNQDDVLLPDLDRVPARAAEQILDFVREHGTD